MSDLGFDFDPEEHRSENDGDFQPIPAAWYPLEIKSAELQPTKNGSGQRLNVRFDVLTGQYADRVIFEGLNIKNHNEKAQQIALEHLGAIGRAAGTGKIRTTEQLVGKRLIGKVKVQEAQGDFPAKNTMSGQYKPFESPAAQATPDVSAAPW